MPKLTPLQIAQERLRAAKEALDRESGAADRLERRRIGIGKEISDIENQRKSLAVAATTNGKSAASSQAAQLAVRRSELTSELELIEIAVPEIQERLQPFIREVEEAQADVFEAEIKAMGAGIVGIGGEIDSVLVLLNAALSKREQAINELELKGANGNPRLAVQNSLIRETVHRMKDFGSVHAAVAYVRGLSLHLHMGGGVPADAIKPMEASMAEVAGFRFPSR